MLPSLCVIFVTVILHSDFFAGKRISPIATESYNSSINYNRRKPSVIFCVQFSTFLYKCAIFYQFTNKHVQFGMNGKQLHSHFLCLRVMFCDLLQPPKPQFYSDSSRETYLPHLKFLCCFFRGLLCGDITMLGWRG